MDYNRHKGDVDNLDMVIGAYSCRRMTARWPLAIFAISLTFPLTCLCNLERDQSDRMFHKSHKRRVFLEQLGKVIVAPFIERSKNVPRTEASAQIVKSFPSAGLPDRPDDQASTSTFKASKRKRCQFCPKEKGNNTNNTCFKCNKCICKGCSLSYCSS
ncbi:unnamed protein product [Lepeophtheirus salmonis]|uniref:(salmon louse) hypothetical protein n=1 Tax=Lepeophtheirus salmonis TaxID=72036 RepID=A0A7R8CXE7_LEPSM|nr:unnamed protein product [Lepeophtheirus salmonis]CAF2959501.1 unnamed protein product [Lepeophtheirus salmonis]